jgi:hypothetical protein
LITFPNSVPPLLNLQKAKPDDLFCDETTQLAPLFAPPRRAKGAFQISIGYHGRPKSETHEPPLFFHLGRDPSEKRNVSADHPVVLAQIQQAVKGHQSGILPGTPQLR